jgi:hypothetical protein
VISINSKNTSAFVNETSLMSFKRGLRGSHLTRCKNTGASGTLNETSNIIYRDAGYVGSVF